MVSVSNFVVPLTVSVTVTSDVLTATLAAVISRLLRRLTLAPTVVLKRQPPGRVKMNVLLVPFAKSVVSPSVMTISPSAVKAAPLVELNDVSAEMPLTPVGSVTVTSASNDWQKNDSNPTANPSRSTQCCAPPHESPLVLLVPSVPSDRSTLCCAPRHKSAAPLVRRGPDVSGLIMLFTRSLFI